MGRPRKYDPDEVLEAARDAFWRHGFEATSVADLCRATGLEKGSLYHGFGDKRRLYLSVLERYLSGGRAMFDSALAAQSNIVEGVRAWLDHALSGCRVEGEARGCMAINSVVELGPHDDEVAQLLDRHFSEMEAALATALDIGQERGDVRVDRDSKDLAQFITTVLTGLTAGSRGGPTDATASIELAVDTLRPVPR